MKVDNSFKITRANGSDVLPKSEQFTELYAMQWQPHEAGVLPKPDISRLRKDEVKQQEASDKPKRIFKYGKGGSESSVFQQMMRQQMTSTKSSNKGPQKVDANEYKALQA